MEIDTTGSNAVESQKGRAKFKLYLSIQKLKNIIVILYIKIASTTSELDSNSSNCKVYTFSYLFKAFFPSTLDVSHIFEEA
jgi:hypothetical protein